MATEETPSSGPGEVVVKPLVLLSAVDHYNRCARDSRGRRVVGVLLGEHQVDGTTKAKSVQVTNSFAVPFEEDPKNPTIWYVDHDFLENMAAMHRKVSAREKIVGFYSTGPKIREADFAIERLFRRYCPEPVLVIIDVRPECEGLPTQAYIGEDQVEEDGSATKRTFRHIPSSVGASEAEEVGVEHLLRDINDPSVSSLATQVRGKMSSLQGLRTRLTEMRDYLDLVLEGRLPCNSQIVHNCQVIFNLLPNLNVERLVRALYAQTNDFYQAIYVAALVRCIIALHDLVKNKIQFGSDEANATATTSTTSTSNASSAAAASSSGASGSTNSRS